MNRLFDKSSLKGGLRNKLKGSPLSMGKATDTATSSSINASLEQNSLGPGDESQRLQAPFWPGEFIPTDFPRSRVLTWGYDSDVSRFFAGAVSHHNYYSHARDLLYDINGIRARGCVS